MSQGVNDSLKRKKYEIMKDRVIRFTETLQTKL